MFSVALRLSQREGTRDAVMSYYHRSEVVACVWSGRGWWSFFAAPVRCIFGFRGRYGMPSHHRRPIVISSSRLIVVVGFWTSRRRMEPCGTNLCVHRRMVVGLL